MTDTQNTYKPITHNGPCSREEHFANLNGYDNDGRYSPGECAYVVGHRWEVTEEIFNEFLNVLPPIRWIGDSFCMSEMLSGSITSMYFKDSLGRYWHEWVDLRKR
jgi:hypothetical protein